MDKRQRRLAQAKYDPLGLPPSKIKSGCPMPSTIPPHLYKETSPPESGMAILTRQNIARHSRGIEASHDVTTLRQLEPPIYWIGRQWAVTHFGLEEIRPGGYHIAKNDLSKRYWISYMEHNDWVDIADFGAALSFAQRLFKITIHGSKCEVGK